MHPIDVAYKHTVDDISERLSKVKAEVDEIELLATTKIATLYDGKIAALRASAVTMESQVNELKTLIGEDCGAIEGEDTAPSKEEQNPVTPSEWNDLARERNATISRVNEYLMPLCDHRNQPIPHFPSTASDLKNISHKEVVAILQAIGMSSTDDHQYDLERLAARIGISESLFCHLGFSAMYMLPYSLLESQKSL